jgi:hypothetical protein
MGEDVCDRGDISLINERISMTTSFNCPGDRQAGFLEKPGSTAQSRYCTSTVYRINHSIVPVDTRTI